jgi:hypothetical protein
MMMWLRIYRLGGWAGVVRVWKARPYLRILSAGLASLPVKIYRRGESAEDT